MECSIEFEITTTLLYYLETYINLKHNINLDKPFGYLNDIIKTNGLKIMKAMDIPNDFQKTLLDLWENIPSNSHSLYGMWVFL